MSLDINHLRSHFPALSITDDGKPRIYLDNPAGTQVPERVLFRMKDCLVRTNANLGGHFSSSKLADEGVEAAHAAVADLINAPSPDEIIFGQNMTSLTFHISRSIGKELRPGDEIVVTRMDHDANISPWMMLARDIGCTLRWIDFDPDTYQYDLDYLHTVITPKTKLVAVNYASNLLGTINDVRSIIEAAHEQGAMVFVDSVQFTPHGITDVQDLGCDFLACSAYKFFGPHQGIIWGRREILERLQPYKVRPAGNGLPHRFETGTLSHEDMAGTLGAIEYLEEVGKKMGADVEPVDGENMRRYAIRSAMTALLDYEMKLAARLIEGLQEIPGVTVRGITDPGLLKYRVPTVSFSHIGVDPADIAHDLAKKNIFVWSGHNYAVEVVRRLKLLTRGGAVRIGIVHYNTEEEIDTTLEAVRESITRRK